MTRCAYRDFGGLQDVGRPPFDGSEASLTLALAVMEALLLLSLVSQTGVQLARVERTDVRRTMVVFAAPQALTTGLDVTR